METGWGTEMGRGREMGFGEADGLGEGDGFEVGDGFWDGLGFREGDWLALVPAAVFCDVCRQRGGGLNYPPFTFRVLGHIARTFQRLPIHFRGQPFQLW